MGLAPPTAVGGGCLGRAPPGDSTGRPLPLQREPLSGAECSDCCELRPTAMSSTLLVKFVKLATLKMELRLEPADMLLQALPRRLLPRRPEPSKKGAPASRPRLGRGAASPAGGWAIAPGAAFVEASSTEIFGALELPGDMAAASMPSAAAS